MQGAHRHDDGAAAPPGGPRRDGRARSTCAGRSARVVVTTAAGVGRWASCVLLGDLGSAFGEGVEQRLASVLDPACGERAPVAARARAR